MEYNLADIVGDTKVALDLNVDSTPLADIGDVDTLALDEIIESKVAEAVRRVEETAPIHLLDKGKEIGGTVVWNSDKSSGYIMLPDDFMRLVSFKMSDWHRPLFAAITPESPEYALQYSPFPGLRGNPQKPVCALVMHSDGMALEFFACKDDGQTVAQAQYIGMPEVKDGKIEICPKCYRAVVYMAASLAAATINDSDKAAAMSALSEASLK